MGLFGKRKKKKLLLREQLYTGSYGPGRNRKKVSWC